MAHLRVHEPEVCSDPFGQMLDNPHDLDSVLEHIRLSRMKLGSILDRLESFDPQPDAVGQLHDHAECVAIEIQLMIEALRQYSDG